MDFRVFRDHFRTAAIAARDFARKFIEESLPDPMVFRVRLNCSDDDNPLREDERVYPEDSSFERALALSECSEELVLSTLWRDGAVPEWIDLSVIGETGEATLIELRVCGRYTAKNELLYNQQEDYSPFQVKGYPPFHIKGPVYPANYSSSKRLGHSDPFSLYDRSECWQEKDLKRVQRYSNKVWSLALNGPGFDDQLLSDLPEFSGLRILELNASAINGSGLKNLDRYSKLHVLRIWLLGKQAFTLEHLPTLPTLTNLEINGLLANPVEINALAEKLPSLSALHLCSSEVLNINGKIPQANLATALLGRLILTAQRLTGDLTLPRHLKSLILHLVEATPEEIEKLLEPVESIQSLHLRNTPMNEAAILRLISRFQLDFLDIVDTGLDKEAVQRIAATSPRLRILPNYGKSTDQ